MRRISLAVAVMIAVLGGAAASAHEPCSNCLGGYFERPFTDARYWRRPTFYYRAVHRRQLFYYVVLRPCRACGHRY